MANLFALAKLYAPQLLVGTGIGLGATTVFVACMQTMKAEKILDRHNAEMEMIERAKKVAKPDEYTDRDIKHDRLMVWKSTGKDFAKLYAPAIAFGGASIGFILGGFNVLNSRLCAAGVALSVTEGLFANYRSNVIKDAGVEKDREYLYNTKIKKGALEQIVVNPETGENEIVKQDAEFIDIDLSLATGAIRIFGEFNSDGSKNYEWDDNVDICLSVLRAKQNYWNDCFKHRGIIFLNEVAKDCGLNITQAGQVLGWKYAEGKVIDFGLGDYSDPNIRRFINGRSDCLILHFNVDGEYTPDGELKSVTPVIGELKE